MGDEALLARFAGGRFKNFEGRRRPACASLPLCAVSHFENGRRRDAGLREVGTYEGEIVEDFSVLGSMCVLLIKKGVDIDSNVRCLCDSFLMLKSFLATFFMCVV